MVQIRTGDQSFVKALNKSIVLNIVRSQSPISRAHIAKVSGLNKATVSTLMDELIAERMVHEVGQGESKGGRRPRLLMLNERAAVVAGIDVGVGYLLAVVMDLRTKVLWRRRIPMDHRKGPEACLETAAGLIQEGLDAVPAPPLGLLGIGVGVPGLVDEAQSRLLFAPNLKWADVPIRDWLHRQFGVPILVANEANAGAIGEVWAGSAGGTQSLVYLSVGIGLGAGIILNGELYRGMSGVAGELGHTTIDITGPVCPCGNRGCWELFASETALRSQIARAVAANPLFFSPLAPRDPDTLDTEDVVAAAESNDPIAISALSTIGDHLGVGITNIINSFNPSLIIIGGSLAQAGSYVLNPARRTVEQRTTSHSRARTQIVLSTLGPSGCAVGAGAMVLQEQFRLPALIL